MSGQEPPASSERALIWGIVCLVVAAPLAIGSVHPTTQVALSVAGLLLSTAYVVIRRRRGVKLTWFTAWNWSTLSMRMACPSGSTSVV